MRADRFYFGALLLLLIAAVATGAQPEAATEQPAGQEAVTQEQPAVVVAEQAPVANEAAPAPGFAPAPGLAVVYRDPETGRLGHVPLDMVLELKEIEQMISTSGKGLEEYKVEGGAWVVNLKGRFHNVMVATVSEDGEPQVQCLGGSAQAEQAITAAVQAAVKEE